MTRCNVVAALATATQPVRRVGLSCALHIRNDPRFVTGMDIVLWHNPRCSKSRAALALLQEHGHTPQVVDYQKTPPDAAQIRSVLAKLELPARALLRSGESVYVELGLADERLDEAALVQAMATHPVLIERPLAMHGRRAVIGRPPERVLELLDD